LPRLPIYEVEDGIVSSLKTHPRLILQAPTGSGKSTQVPQILLKHGLRNGQIVILQPRRLAARLLARRVAHELGVQLGREVGYQVRFENVTSDDTRIQFETEGILLRRIIQDPELRGIQVVVFDEFHERHLYGDVSLAKALDIQERSRSDLLIIVMSATLDAAVLGKYLEPCVILTSQGRTFPVAVEYDTTKRGMKPPPIWEIAADAFAQSAAGEDVMIFMPGGYEIARTIEAVRRKPEAKGYLLLPLHGELPPADQDAAVMQYDQPKVVVTTNVAEASITIDGIRLVIDSGLARIPRYDPNRGINTLLIDKISRASADQRAGRAGRTAPGRCIRLWSEAEQGERPRHETPEVQRLDLSEVVLTLKAAGVDDLRSFRWLERPGDTALRHAEELLEDLGALDRKAGNGITDLGRRMLAFPVHPRYSRMLIAASQYGCVYHACLIAALTQGRDLLIRRPADRQVSAAREDLFGDHHSSDFWILIRVWDYAVKHRFNIDDLRSAGIHAATARQIGPLLDQFLKIARDEGLEVRPSPVNDAALRKCILIGFSDRLARRLDDSTFRCELVHGRRGTLVRESAVQSPLFVAAEVQEIGGRGSELAITVSLATAVEIDWLLELFPNDVRSELNVQFDSGTKRVEAADVIKFRDLILTSKRVDPPAEAAAKLLANEIVEGRLRLPKWDHAVEQWILRLNLVAVHCPELQLSPIRDEDRRQIIEQLCLGGVSYKDIRDRDIAAMVKTWISADQWELVNKYAPDRVTLSNGRTPKVVYDSRNPPNIALRIQELFGVTQTPRIARGKLPLSVHILAPSMRPVQVTQDLESFWRDHYPRIKSELKRKYPKHEWR